MAASNVEVITYHNGTDGVDEVLIFEMAPTAAAFFLGVPKSTWITVLIICAAVFAVLVLLLLLCAFCSSVRRSKQAKAAPKTHIPYRQVCIPSVEKETLIEQHDVIIQMPSGEQILASSERKSSRRSKRSKKSKKSARRNTGIHTAKSMRSAREFSNQYNPIQQQQSSSDGGLEEVSLMPRQDTIPNASEMPSEHEKSRPYTYYGQFQG